MSLIEQSSLPKGQDNKLQEMVTPTEKSVDVPAELSSIDSTSPSKEDPLQVLVDADDEQCLIEEAKILNTKEAKTKEIIIDPPTIPKRNTLRTSRLLDSLRLNTIESATKSLNTTHNVYLSSEEDASSSADEYSDYDYESSSEESEKSPVRRVSQEVTARAVSVVFVGKPCVIDLTNGRRSVSPVKRPQSEFFGRSISTSSFETDSLRSRPEHPPRKTSLASVNNLPKESPSFLSQDPFSISPYTRRESVLTIETTTSPGPYPRAPRTPTAAFQRIQKTISLARKRSRPNLKAAAANSASMTNLDLPALNTSQEATQNKLNTASPATVIMPQTPVTYNEILRVARRNSIAVSGATQSSSVHNQPASPITPIATKRSLLSGLALNRRRSMRIKT
ncbi:hypothetical protein HD806DRAFT_97470 [Xylariaceae sp. AK1471]|nr:hypothetical protein HD806DRAFT_97470 [Xylariaceae sp. AK1471]